MWVSSDLALVSRQFRFQTKKLREHQADWNHLPTLESFSFRQDKREGPQLLLTKKSDNLHRDINRDRILKNNRLQELK